jgi:hypothetical protein
MTGLIASQTETFISYTSPKIRKGSGALDNRIDGYHDWSQEKEDKGSP